MSTNPRQLALQALRQIQRGAFADVALDRCLQSTSLSGADRRLATELVYGTLRRQRTLDTLIDQLARKPAAQQPPELRLILQVGLYQLRYLSHIPTAAAVHTSVELAKHNGFAGLAGFVNGLLRQALRRPDLPRIDSANPATRLGILHSYPDWIVQVWLDQFGPTDTEQLCQWFNQPPAIDLRINTRRTCLDAVAASFQAAGIETQRLPHLPQALRLLPPVGPIPTLPGFAEGWWVVQDASAQLVGYLVDPQPGETIADACAAPGGKTLHLAELMQDKGTVWAIDLTPSRLKKIQQNIDRLGLQSIQIKPGDSRNLPDRVDHCDRVLVDAPCSGLGTLHRHADARWRQTPASVQDLAELQHHILAHTATWVQSGGVLVYATCTLHPAENETQIERFLAEQPNWFVEVPDADTPVYPFLTPQGWVKVLPHRHHMDGFFMVRLKKG